MGFVGDLFGKGGSSAAPPMPSMPQADYSGLENMMMGMENMMMGAMGSIVQAQQMMQEQAMQQQESILAQMNANVTMPEVYRTPEVDFTEAQDRLNAKAKADFHLDQMRRKSATDTILTSPLLDEEEPNVGGSVLTGGS